MPLRALICLLLMSFGILMPQARAAAAPLTVENLKCEYRTDPLGVDTARPRLAWWLASGVRGQRQTACQILIASSRERLAKDQGDLWDSGKVASDANTQIAYAGKPLASLQQVFWKVRAWDKDGKPSAWSSPSTWTMGLLKPGDWQAKWITFDTTPKTNSASPAEKAAARDQATLDNPNQRDKTQSGLDASGKPLRPLPLFRRVFTVDKPLRRAVVSVCGLGQYELSLNGARVGDHEMDPGWTNYKKSCLYASYDVTGQLKPGRNALGVMLGNGMYNVTGGRYVKFLGSFGQPKLILNLRLDYADGSSATIASDASWKAAAGPLSFSCVYGGEDCDARQEQPGWNTAAFDDSAWQGASVTDGPGGRLVAQAQPPIKVMEEFKTVKVTEPRPGVKVYDLGRNFSGRPALTVSGPAGARVKLIPGELLGKNGLVTQRQSGSPVYYTYTLKGVGEEAWHPRFSYYGFRYVQVETQPASGSSALPQIKSLTGQFTHSSAAVAGRFECSSDRVNRIHKLIDAAIESNFQSVLTDCPHREKLGWLEQSHLLGRSIMFGYDVPNLYAKISRDMAESQLENGLVPDIAPEYVTFKNGFRDSPEWGSAAVIDPWLAYQMYGDLAFLEANYETMAKYTQYLGTQAKNGIIAYGLGDWYDIGPRNPGVSQLTSLGLTATAVYCQDLAILEKSAALLGRAEDAKKWGGLLAQTRERFIREFFHPESSTFDRNSQTANAMALTLGLVPEERRTAVMESLVRQIRAGGNRVTAGDIGFHYLVRALAEGGCDDVLYAMTTQDQGPGYVYQLNKGATTLTEAWDTNPGSSQNHFMLGHIEDWFFTGLGGLTPAAPGFREFKVKPAVVGDLQWARVDYDSVMGRIQSKWSRQGGKLKLEVTVPVSTTATLYVPAKNADAVSESGKPAGKAEGVRFVKQENGRAVYEVASGKFSFEVR